MTDDDDTRDLPDLTVRRVVAAAVVAWGATFAWYALLLAFDA